MEKNGHRDLQQGFTNLQERAHLTKREIPPITARFATMPRRNGANHSFTFTLVVELLIIGCCFGFLDLQSITEWDDNRRLCIINAWCCCAWDTSTPTLITSSRAMYCLPPDPTKKKNDREHHQTVPKQEAMCNSLCR